MEKSETVKEAVQACLTTSNTQSQNVAATQAALTSGQIQALASIAGPQAAIGAVPQLSGLALPTVSFTLPRAVSAYPSITQPIQLSTASLSGARFVSPHAFNIIQRQISTGVVGLSSVPAGLPTVPATVSPITLVAASSAAGLEQRRTVMQEQQQAQRLLGNTATSSNSTIHLVAMPSPANPASNLNRIKPAIMSDSPQSSAGVSLKRSHSAPMAMIIPSTLPSSPTPSITSVVSTKTKDLKLLTSMQQSPTIAAVGDPSPKKIKLEEKPAPNKEVENLRYSVCAYKRQKMREIKNRYRENLTELFYLQGGGNLVEFHSWKKRPTQPLLSFLEESRLDSEDENEEYQDSQLNDEVKIATSGGSVVPSASSSSLLPASMSTLGQQDGNHSAVSSLTSTSLPTTTHSELQQHLTKSSDVKLNQHHSKNSSQTLTSKVLKTNVSPVRQRQHSVSSVYENVTGGSQDIIVERAKQEAQVLQRVNELRKEGMWSAKRLPRVQEPARQKAHWDYLLEEMTWLAADFIQERKWKKAAARKIARMVANHFKEQEQKELRAEKEEAIRLKKIASQLAKMVKEFWINIEKVVQYKQTTRLEEKKKKALDLHLSFIVDQTEKYSSWLTAGLQTTDGSKHSSEAEHSVDSGEEFKPIESGSDDEETIELEEKEAGLDEDATKKEVEALQRESEIPIEELLKSLPKEMLDTPSNEVVFEESDSGESDISQVDQDFTAVGQEEADVEETIEEQEKQEQRDYSQELEELKAEGEMTVEELVEKYAGAYDSDFEVPEDSEGESGEEEEDDYSESEKESGESSEEEEPSETEDKEDEVKKEIKNEENVEDMGLEFLVKKATTSQAEESSTEGPGKEFNDIAAAAQSLQPKGYTLETTEVKTKVPFLLKHSLREYQHVGLDWLATMNEKRLNGILADEMGLGKTIQTIALLGHLACEKGIWGPHLIVVPTSVMLNWEMEFKKWCPAFKILTYYGSIKERKLKRQGWTKTNAFHVCITSYKLVVQDHQAFRRKKWKYFILDEAQNIKNFKSQRWQMLLNFSSQRRLLLTGTPLQNSLMELWSLMHFLMPNVFQSHSEFKEWFSNPLTGMIEGSQEYNESLVRRLHKVLRPFLLRRLKNEVEKQMPQKFEHVVMCRLSKRQRFLYDDFMSQTKTKETLATGHFMSVINILMQLRKVCNHPDLFDPRPIISPFKMEGIVFTTASLATRVLEFDPFNDINIHTFFPNLAEMERDLPSFVAERIKELKAGKKLIEEVDSLPDPAPRLPSGHLKNRVFSPSVLENEKTSPVVASTSATESNSRPASPLMIVKPTMATMSSSPSTVNSIKLLLPSPSSTTTTSSQQTVLIPNPSGSGPTLILPLSSISSSSTAAAIAQAKFISSQLQSGMLQLVQTSSGQQILTTSMQNSAAISSCPTLSTTTTTTALPSSMTSTTPSSCTVFSSSSLLKSPSGVLQQHHTKPVMRVSPLLVSSVSGTIVSSSVMSSTTTKLSSLSDKPVSRKPVKRSDLFLESLYYKQVEHRNQALATLARLSEKRCDASPAHGPDVHHCVECLKVLDPTNCVCSPTPSLVGQDCDLWRGNGYVNCLVSQDHQLNHSHPDIYRRESCHLQQLVHSPAEWLEELKETLAQFVFVTPTVISPSITLQVAHPNQSDRLHLEWLESRLRPVILDKSALLHPIQSRTLVTFPDLRLIQYDCGKLQTLDLLLRQLKSGQHRVLIFTQMTKMLDVLEAFLNFHGHRYLRLDGTTKVEQRQYLMDRFNADPRIFCFILSTRSGGVGVNLTGADTVVFYDSDWNPTMDAQAQDRCHRIGQTRDVHIYRLVSEMTVEENILKKANQKRLLGDLAIEGGNFTTAFFKEQTISDLFAEPSGLDSLVEARQKETEEKEKARQEKAEEEAERKEKEETKKESAILSQFEQALCKAEDETDAQAAKQVQAEQKAELAEFDENIPWDEREGDARREDDDDVSKVEMELALLEKELSPIERYAVTVMEAQMEPETAEELKLAEEDIENSKKDWELARLKALKEEEERRAELEDDEMLYIYSRDESQVKRGRKPLKKNASNPKVKSGNTSMSGSDVEDSSSCRKISGGKKTDRPSPQKINGVTLDAEQKNVSISKVKKAKAALAKAAVSESKKMKAAANALKKKNQKGPPKKRGRKPKVKPPDTEAESKLNQSGPSPKQKTKITKAIKSTPNAENSGNVEKKIKVVKVKNLEHLQNGHSMTLAKLNSKIATQAKNAMLKQQAQQAGHITVTPVKNNPHPPPPLQPPHHIPVSLVANYVTSPISKPPVPSPVPKPTVVPKSPADPNVPPPWSNPNLVIRTRKAAVHSPVVIRPSQQKLLLQQQSQPTVLQQASVLQHSLSRPLVYSSNPTITVCHAASAISASTPTISLSSVASAANLAKLQGTPDRNIFQIFTPNTSNIATIGGMAFNPNVRQVGPGVSGTPVLGQLRGATVINSLNVVNPTNLAGARLITTCMPTQSAVVVSAAPKTGALNLAGHVSNITLVPTVINASGGQTLLPASGATVVSAQGATRALLNTGKLTSPITLQSLGSLPFTVNLIKTSTGLTLPIRSQQILQTSVGGQPGYVLITPTPRVRAPTPVTQSATVAGVSNPISIVHHNLSGQGLQGGRVHLVAQVPSSATVIQQPQPHQLAKSVNGVASSPSPAKSDGT